MTDVQHGADANYLRPEVATPVTWVGSVYPNFAVEGDLWVCVGVGPSELKPLPYGVGYEPVPELPKGRFQNLDWEA